MLAVRGVAQRGHFADKGERFFEMRTSEVFGAENKAVDFSKIIVCSYEVEAVRSFYGQGVKRSILCGPLSWTVLYHLSATNLGQ